jgi:hypothetical protein
LIADALPTRFQSGRQGIFSRSASRLWRANAGSSFHDFDRPTGSDGNGTTIFRISHVRGASFLRENARVSRPELAHHDKK